MNASGLLYDADRDPRARRQHKPKPIGPQKDPSTAFSWSLALWGAGQMYVGRVASGLLLLLLMINVVLTPFFVQIYLENRSALPIDVEMPAPMLVKIAGGIYLGSVLVWALGAVLAYFQAVRLREVPFTGTPSHVYPGLCSLLIPGWGQFLNGQPKKGVLFLLMTVVGLLSAAALAVIPLAWPFLETAQDRLLWEWILLAAIIAAPLVVLAWPIAAYDAFAVSRDDTMKEPWRKRLEYANNRRRMYGWVRGVFPFLTETLVLAFLLAACLGAAYAFAPTEYYAARIQSAAERLSAQNMVLIPGVLERLADAVLAAPSLR